MAEEVQVLKDIQITDENLHSVGLKVSRQGAAITHFSTRIVYNDPTDNGQNTTFEVEYKPMEMALKFGFVVSEVNGDKIIYTSRANQCSYRYTKEDIRCLLCVACDYVESKVGLSMYDQQSIVSYMKLLGD